MCQSGDIDTYILDVFFNRMINFPNLQLGLALSYIYLPLFFSLQMTSSFQYLERRFGSTIRTMASGMYVFKTLCFIPLVVYVPALALSQGKTKSDE